MRVGATEPQTQTDPARRDAAANTPARVAIPLLLVSLLLPAALLALASWKEYRDVFQDAETQVERTMRVLQEHAIKVFETQKLILERVNGRMSFVGYDTDQKKNSANAFLTQLQKEYDQVATISVTDMEGRMIVSSRAHPSDASISFADRDWYLGLKNASAGTVYVSRSYVGRQSGQGIFNIARRFTPEEGGFSGIVVVSLDRAYFENFYRQVDPGQSQNIALLREDGQILARSPLTAMQSLAADSPLMRLMRSSAGPLLVVSAVDGTKRLAAFRRVGNYPIYLGLGLSEKAILDAWWDNVAAYAFIAGLAAMALVAVSLYAVRQTRQEHLATERWRVTVDALTAEAGVRQHAEAQLRQAQKMEAVGRLTGGVAHDFNNLLTVVIGNLELARRRATEIDPRVARGLDNAMEGARRAATLTNRLLAFSRQSPLAPELVDTNRLVSGMTDLFARTLGEHVRVETALAGSVWPTLADINQTESTLLNLAVNARDAMPHGGRLTIETGNAVLDEAYCAGHEDLKAGQYAMIAVSDTGIGMSPEVIAQAFEPFFTTKPAGKGSGLGLAQVYGFMRQSGGHVAIYSETSQGTVVKLYFPRHIQKAEADRAAIVEIPRLLPEAVERAPQPGLTVLTVEDDAMVRAFSVSALEEAGYQVLEAASGPEALDLVDAHPRVDLLFTDVILGGPYDGRRLAHEAVARKPDLKVLYTTGYTRHAIVHQGKLDEDVEFLSKPFTAASLGRKVRAVLSRA